MKVKFLPTGKEIEISPEKTLLQAAFENGVQIKSVCKGKLACAECRVTISEGESNCLPPSLAEQSLLGTSWQIESKRFSCQVRCFGPITVDLKEQIQRDETSKKNIRGFKGSKQAEKSQAVQDTLILNEGTELQNKFSNKK
jgi:ferredoxin, 2Fe-2S